MTKLSLKQETEMLIEFLDKNKCESKATQIRETLVGTMRANRRNLGWGEGRMGEVAAVLMDMVPGGRTRRHPYLCLNKHGKVFRSV